MIERPDYLNRLRAAIRRSPVTALLGARQCGKTTLARQLAGQTPSTLFDLESVPDQRRLQNPELVLGSLTGLVILDEIQAMTMASEHIRRYHARQMPAEEGVIAADFVVIHDHERRAVRGRAVRHDADVRQARRQPPGDQVAGLVVRRAARHRADTLL